jgi:hypothetical protein
MKQEAGLREIAQMLERHMTDMGFTETEKTALIMSVVIETVTAKLKASPILPGTGGPHAARRDYGEHLA